MNKQNTLKLLYLQKKDTVYIMQSISRFYQCFYTKGRPRGASGQALASHRWGPEFASRSRHVGFVVDETGSGQVFHGVSPVFPYHKFHSTISPPSSHPFSFISSALVMVRQAWSAGTLATHGPIIWGLHRISSLDPTLCWTRVEDIYFYTKVCVGVCVLPSGSNFFSRSWLFGAVAPWIYLLCYM